MQFSKEVELITKMPVELLNALEDYSKQAGFKNSAEFMAKHVKRSLAIYFDIDEHDQKLQSIY